jgi:hypothetical protein
MRLIVQGGSNGSGTQTRHKSLNLRATRTLPPARLGTWNARSPEVALYPTSRGLAETTGRWRNLLAGSTGWWLGRSCWRRGGRRVRRLAPSRRAPSSNSRRGLFNRPAAAAFLARALDGSRPRRRTGNRFMSLVRRCAVEDPVEWAEPDRRDGGPSQSLAEGHLQARIACSARRAGGGGGDTGDLGASDDLRPCRPRGSRCRGGDDQGGRIPEPLGSAVASGPSGALSRQGGDTTRARPSAKTVPAIAPLPPRGFSVTRLTWNQLDDEPEAIAIDLRNLLGRAASTSTCRSGG